MIVCRTEKSTYKVVALGVVGNGGLSGVCYAAVDIWEDCGF
jgi:hypothetical protein